ncbi:MAG: nuclear transport factor 2 family protein [Deltaproteobacteria bacterium]|nr:nuclear transport factor 2 family protein [Deltaproteobacteria bacterium]MBW2446405.1 nuclear transport factor 2 family protein [Deltaproteobacteria bacterium]
MPYSKQEILDAYDRYVAVRDRAERGEVGWDALAEHFTEDAWFSDPAWGRVEGRPAIRQFMEESMTGLEGWTFPRLWTSVEGDQLVSVWKNRLPGTREDGSFFEASGASVMTYAGNGQWASEEDLLNMAHVMELIRESGWLPGAGAKPPPAKPKR